MITVEDTTGNTARGWSGKKNTYDEDPRMKRNLRSMR
jgi:hypothetical protein